LTGPKAGISGYDILAQAESDIPAAPIDTVAGAIEDRQTRARNLILQLEHPGIAAAKSIANPIRFSNTLASSRLPPAAAR
jgi:crotonobetainyl-CoA:carnitine CoA-transferase CaiB-like acyl-CoA transferase